MELVKFDESLVQVIGREKNEFTILTRERKEKRISASHIITVKEWDIHLTLKELKREDIVYLPEYRKLKRYCCNE